MSVTVAAGVPSFRTHSLPLGLLRDLAVVALCAALVGGFLAAAWRAPAPGPAPGVPPAAATAQDRS